MMEPISTNSDGAAPIKKRAKKPKRPPTQRQLEIGAAVRDLRTRANMGTDDLVALTKRDGRTGLSKGTINAIENAEVESLDKTYRILADALGEDTIETVVAKSRRLRGLVEDGVEGNPSRFASNHLTKTPGADGVPLPPAGGTRTAREVPNSGRIFEESRVRWRPVYRWGTLGDPTSVEDAPQPHRFAPLFGSEGDMVGERGFGVEVRGESMLGWKRPIWDGEICWVNPQSAKRYGGLVCALAQNGSDTGTVVKEWNIGPDGRECLFSHYAPDAGGRRVFSCDGFRIVGPVVGIHSWRSPDE